jgi:hypothetical protein
VREYNSIVLVGSPFPVGSVITEHSTNLRLTAAFSELRNVVPESFGLAFLICVYVIGVGELARASIAFWAILSSAEVLVCPLVCAVPLSLPAESVGDRQTSHRRPSEVSSAAPSWMSSFHDPLWPAEPP